MEFDGERTDPFTGWQFLGAGHRTYNPKQRYFVSEDPAGSGYVFGSNNPVMNTDPSGNMPHWLEEIPCSGQVTFQHLDSVRCIRNGLTSLPL